MLIAESAAFPGEFARWRDRVSDRKIDGGGQAGEYVRQVQPEPIDRARLQRSIRANSGGPEVRPIDT